MEEIEFNVTTPDAAYEFAKKFTGFTGHELINAYIIESDSNFDEFWERYHEGFEQLGINEISLVAYHVVGSIDECAEIINKGILNLQTVLSQDTSISRLLKNYGIIFDIHNRIMICDGKEYNIDYYAYEDIFIDDCLEGKLKKIGHRIYYDFCVDGFFYCRDISQYGTDIHERPEFFRTLVNFSDSAKELDAYWRKNSKSYKVYFKVPLSQIHRFTFDFDEGVKDYSEEELLLLKKKLLSIALDVAYDECLEKYIYLKDDEYVHPEQIIRCEEILTSET